MTFRDAEWRVLVPYTGGGQVHGQYWCGRCASPTRRVEGGMSVHLLVSMMETAAYDREWAEQGKYLHEVLAVVGYTQSQAVKARDVLLAKIRYPGLESSEAARETCGEWARTHATISVLLAEHGYKAVLFAIQGNSKAKGLAACRDRMPDIGRNIVDYMEKPQNAAGSNGWEFVFPSGLQ